MSITYPPELLPSPDEGQGADVWVQCTCGCGWDPTMLASCPVCDPKEITDSKAAEITKLKSQLEEARARVNELETGFSTGLAEIKDELNGLAMMGAVPMWGSLIGRLDDLAVEVLNGGGKR